ncbi:MAG: MBOAT family protein, partial [Lachnospiraceae bacterium]|nr:MBOAT family protein [Lachnospiraceae bacterium]
MAFLVGMSLWFYGYNNIWYLLILIVSIIMNYVIVYGMAHFSEKKLRRLFLACGLALNIGILFYFKYYDFFIENINAVLKSELPFLRLALPLGISFYTFQQLSYVIDCYRQECTPYSFLEYAAYVSYFPQLIAGPIVYHSELIPQFRDESKKRLNFDNLSKGLYAFSLGLSKKVLLADTFSKIVTAGYAGIPEL